MSTEKQGSPIVRAALIALIGTIVTAGVTVFIALRSQEGGSTSGGGAGPDRIEELHAAKVEKYRTLIADMSKTMSIVTSRGVTTVTVPKRSHKAALTDLVFRQSSNAALRRDELLDMLNLTSKEEDVTLKLPHSYKAKFDQMSNTFVADTP